MIYPEAEQEYQRRAISKRAIQPVIRHQSGKKRQPEKQGDQAKGLSYAAPHNEATVTRYKKNLK